MSSQAPFENPRLPPGPPPSPGQTYSSGQPLLPGQAPPLGAPPGYPGGPGQPRQNAPGAVASLVLGIIGILACLICAPIAWVMGRRAEKEIAANPGLYSGKDFATAGKILGIAGTVLLALAILIVIVAVIVTAASSSTSTVYTG